MHSGIDGDGVGLFSLNFRGLRPVWTALYTLQYTCLGGVGGGCSRDNPPSQERKDCEQERGGVCVWVVVGAGEQRQVLKYF
ncbi:hypothetical protein JZ751_018921 [Albula glossodonta]|uniref:Uncharacterized protein n=1 Tax=Albula glossodonta TaxID=121402 RepID=A0A8T2N0U9_9TELE|nr:hypothetical protein JZ751_018921 [Albula glossodonta]